VLRFFENRTASEIAAALKVTEDAAQKRAARALDRLRTVFRKHGVSSTTAIIAGAISANSIQAAPPSLAKSIATVAMTKGAVANSSTLTLVKGALKYMAWKKAQSAIVAATIVLMLGGGVTIATLGRAKAAPGQSTGRITSGVSGRTRAGRQVKASGDIALGILVQGDIATVSLGEPRFDAAGKRTADHTLVLESQQVLLDGKVRSRIPASATAIEIVCTNRTLSIVADKKLLLAAKLKGFYWIPTR
jgi:hypothetical protein